MAKKGARVSTRNTVGKFSNGRTISTSDTSTASEEITTECIRVYATGGDTFLASGDSSISVTTTDTQYDVIIPSGQVYDISIGDDTHVAAILASGTGTLYYSETE